MREKILMYVSCMKRDEKRKVQKKLEKQITDDCKYNKATVKECLLHSRHPPPSLPTRGRQEVRWKGHGVTSWHHSFALGYELETTG